MLGMLAGPLISGGIDLLGGLFGNSSAKKAAEAQARASQQAIDTQNQMLRTIREDSTGYRNEGTNALRDLNNPEAFQESPGYQYALEQGDQAIQRGRAATGNLASGNALIELQRHGVGAANQEYGNWWDRTMQRVGVGQNATNALATAGQNVANNISGAQVGAGNARASGIVGGSNALVDGLSSIGGALGDYFGNRKSGVKNALNYVTPSVKKLPTVAYR